MLDEAAKATAASEAKAAEEAAKAAEEVASIAKQNQQERAKQRAAEAKQRAADAMEAAAREAGGGADAEAGTEAEEEVPVCKPWCNQFTCRQDLLCGACSVCGGTQEAQR